MRQTNRWDNANTVITNIIVVVIIIIINCVLVSNIVRIDQCVYRSMRTTILSSIIISLNIFKGDCYMCEVFVCLRYQLLKNYLSSWLFSKTYQFHNLLCFTMYFISVSSNFRYLLFFIILILVPIGTCRFYYCIVVSTALIIYILFLTLILSIAD